MSIVFWIFDRFFGDSALFAILLALINFTIYSTDNSKAAKINALAEPVATTDFLANTWGYALVGSSDNTNTSAYFTNSTIREGLLSASSTDPRYYGLPVRCLAK